MNYRAKLLAVIAVAVAASVALVAAIVTSATRRAFERADDQRTEALVAQFRREFTQRGEEVTRQVQGIADGDAILRIAVEVGRPAPDYSQFVSDAEALATSHHLDFLELLAADGTIISSAQSPARFGYHEDWVTKVADWNATSFFLRSEDLSDGAVLALETVRAVPVSDRKLYIVGGERLDRDFLASLVLPAGLRALLYRNLEPGFSPQALIDTAGPMRDAARLAPLIQRAQRDSQPFAATVDWTANAADSETFHVLPLTGRNGELLGAFLVGSSRRQLVDLERYIRLVALIIGLSGIVVGVAVSGWAASRFTRPVEELAAAVRDVAAGDWDRRVEVQSSDEIGQLAEDFNRMTRQLVEQRDRLVQSERVAAWRELARRLAHELKNPLFPLQITVENLLRSRETSPEQFDEVFRESTQTLLAELANLKAIIGRFSDFAKMPAPQLQSVRVNELAEGVAKLFSAQFNTPGRPAIKLALDLDPRTGAVEADPDLLHRALSNLVLNAMDAMPSGGTLTLRTAPRERGVLLEVADTGQGLTPEECARIFTPYYTSKQHGTGLGLAIVQSVVSDHGGKISVSSEPRRGTTFTIELPESPPQARSARGTHV